MPKVEISGYLGGKHQHFAVYEEGGIAPTIAYTDYKDPPKVEHRGD